MSREPRFLKVTRELHMNGGSGIRSTGAVPTATLTSTTLNDGGGSGAAFAITALSTDLAGSFTITAGNGTPTAGIAGQVVFAGGAKDAAPICVMLSAKDADGVDRNVFISATSTANFTVDFLTTLAASEVVEFYYWVCE